VADQVGQRARRHFFHDLALVGLGHDLADTQFVGDLLVEKSADDQAQGFAFARGQAALASSVGRVGSARAGIRMRITAQANR
jgi:hypothetical protein